MINEALREIVRPKTDYVIIYADGDDIGKLHYGELPLTCDEYSEALLTILKERSYEERKVVLTSGKTSSYYIDGKQTTLNPEGATLTGELFYKRIRSSGVKIEAVGGPTLGADPIVTAIIIASYHHQDPILKQSLMSMHPQYQ